MKRSQKRIVLISLDSLVIGLSLLAAAYFLLGYDNRVSNNYLLFAFFVVSMTYLVLSWYFRVYSIINKYSDYRALFTIVASVFAAYTNLYILSMVALLSFNRRFVFLSFFFNAVIIIMPRLVWQIYSQRQVRKQLQEDETIPKRTLVVGAGSGGSLFIQTIQREQTDIELVGIIDSDKNKIGTYLHNIKIMGDRYEILKLVPEYDIEQIVIAIPSLSGEKREEIVDICQRANVPVYNMPNIKDIILGNVGTNQLQELDVVDLLGRQEVKLDQEALYEFFSQKTVLVTGAGGSIGSELCRQVASFAPERLVLLGHGENSIYLIHKELASKYGTHIEIVPVIADIQDRDLMFELMAKFQPHLVYHAAAHKHVPLMEYNPREAIKNNIIGTQNVAEAAKAAKAEKVIMVSTDKAVNPPNVMGATKRVAEMIVTGLNETSCTQFAAVRFGNVLGSRGSVVPLFKEQIAKGGPVTVTDFRMTRYFMTIPEASRLVIQASYQADGGEVFVLDMGEPVKILDLAKKVIKLSGYTEEEIPIVESGIRPGEKLYEELLATNERVVEQIYEKIFVGRVTSLPIEETMRFVDNLGKLSQDQLKPALIKFSRQD